MLKTYALSFGIRQHTRQTQKQTGSLSDTQADTGTERRWTTGRLSNGWIGSAVDVLMSGSKSHWNTLITITTTLPIHVQFTSIVHSSKTFLEIQCLRQMGGNRTIQCKEVGSL